MSNNGNAAPPMTDEDLQFSPEAVEDIATFFEMESKDVEARLQSYQFREMADQWRAANPQTVVEMRSFYAATDLYIWELIKWHASGGYESYRRLVAEVMARFPPESYPSVLDYGSGVGTTALQFASAGYRATIADIPGRTLEFARHRFARRGLHASVVEVSSEMPVLKDTYDIIICFDVLEHVPNPEKLLLKLADHVRQGGIAVIVASFFTNEDFPHHLRSNVSYYQAYTWHIITNSAGLDSIGESMYKRVGNRKVFLRRLRYLFWQLSGVYIMRYPRLRDVVGDA